MVVESLAFKAVCKSVWEERVPVMEPQVELLEPPPPQPEAQELAVPFVCKQFPFWGFGASWVELKTAAQTPPAINRLIITVGMMNFRRFFMGV